MGKKIRKLTPDQLKKFDAMCRYITDNRRFPYVRGLIDDLASAAGGGDGNASRELTRAKNKFGTCGEEELLRCERRIEDYYATYQPTPGTPMRGILANTELLEDIFR